MRWRSGGNIIVGARGQVSSMGWYRRRYSVGGVPW